MKASKNRRWTGCSGKIRIKGPAPIFGQTIHHLNGRTTLVCLDDVYPTVLLGNGKEPVQSPVLKITDKYPVDTGVAANEDVGNRVGNDIFETGNDPRLQV